jgi:hypothetical protein
VALSHSPAVVTNGLVYYHDMSNTQKSWKGAPATNLYTDGDYSSGALHPVRSGTWAIVEDPRNPSKKVLKATPSASTQYHGKDITSVVSTLYSLQMQIYVSPDFNGTNVSMYPEQGGSGAARYYDLTKKGTWQSLKYDGISASTTNIRMLAYVLSAFTTGYVLISNTGVEQNAFATPFVNGTRSNTQAILDLTNNNTITATSLTYASDNTFSFNGSSSYLTIPTSSSLDITSAITLAAWIKPTTSAGFPGIIAKGYATSGGYSLQLRTDNSLWFELDTATSARSFYNPSSTLVSLNVWSYIVATYDGTTMNIYINSQKVGAGFAQSITIGVISTAVTIGQLPGYGYLNGHISAAQIYNRGLSAAEVAQNFNALRGRYGL